MKVYRITIISTLISSAILSGCASSGYNFPASSQSHPVQTYPATSPSYSQMYGTVHSIQLRQAAGTSGVGVGAVVGGVVGGLLGNQVGGGRGKKVATVAGVVGGAMIGHEMERNSAARDTYEVSVRMDNGSYRTFIQDNVSDLQIGGRVRVENERVYRY